MASYEILDEDFPIGRCLQLGGNWNGRYRSILDKREIDTLRLSRYMGWSDAGLEFLRGLAALRGLEVIAGERLDATPLYELGNMEYLHFDSKLSQEFDVSRMARLQFLSLAWTPKLTGIESCGKLKMLGIRGFRDSSLCPYEGLTGLEELTVTSRKIISLEGIRAMVGLRKLTVNYGSKLADIEGMGRLSALESVCFNRCKAFHSLPNLGELENLESLILEDCGQIESLSFLSEGKKLKKLERLLLIGDTKILDGDMKPILGLPSVRDIRLNYWKHYSHTREELLLQLGH